MREIKFRAWDKNNKEMFTDKHLREFFDIFEYGTDIGDTIIMQYIGATDKTKKKYLKLI